MVYGNKKESDSISFAGTKTNISENSSVAVASNINSVGNIVINSGLSLLDTDTSLMNGSSGNTTITGSNIASTNGDIAITSSNNTSINASKDTYNYSMTNKTWEENVTLASSIVVGAQLDAMINAMQVVLGLNMSRTNSDVGSTTYNNSTLIAENGSIKINSLGTQNTEGDQFGGNTTISGANILGQSVTLNTQGNLSVESKQDSYYSKSKTFGLSLGGGVGSKSGSGSVNLGVNYSSGKTDRLWVDNQTSVIGTDSVTINTGNNTNIKGAVIANITNAQASFAKGGGISVADGGGFIDGGNLNINTKTLTYSNLYDHEYSQSSGFGFSTSIGHGSSNTNNQGTASSTNPNQQNNYYPSGSTTISLSNSGYKKEQTTKATIGSGNITIGSTQVFDNSDSSSSTYGDLIASTGGTLVSSSDGTISDSTLSNLNRDINNTQEITRDTITNALNITTTFDNRLLSAAGQKEIAQEMGNLTENLGKEFQFYGEVAKEVYSDAGIIKDSVYKLACEICFVESEAKSLLQQGEKDFSLSNTSQEKFLNQFVEGVEKIMNKDVTNMTNSERISELNRLSNNERDLTNDEMMYRDALWATAKDDPNWQAFRQNHINQIASAIINDPNYISVKNKWWIMDDSTKLNYIDNITQKQQDIFGDSRDINVILFQGSRTLNGQYEANHNVLSINSVSGSYNDFYKVINTACYAPQFSSKIIKSIFSKIQFKFCLKFYWAFVV